MRGDDVRVIVFPLAVRHKGYERQDVDAFMGQLAEHVDAQLPVEALVDSAAFRVSRTGYDRDIVDVFLHSLRSSAGYGTAAGHDSAFALLPGNDAHHPANGDGDWTMFDAGAGIKLVYQGTFVRPYQLFGPNGELFATFSFRSGELRAGASHFTLRRVDATRRTDPTVAALTRSWHQSVEGWHAYRPPEGPGGTSPSREVRRLGFSGSRELVDGAGAPVCWFTPPGQNHRATRLVAFPDGRWFRFPVNSPNPRNIMPDLKAVMTAVDQAGAQVARFMKTSHRSLKVEIVVNPSCWLTDVLKAVLVVVAGDIGQYFYDPSSP